MKVNDFKLTPAYCLYNGVAVMEQDGNRIKFLIEDDGDVLLKERLRRAFESYIQNIKKDDRKYYKDKYRVTVQFEKGSRLQLRKYISELYENTYDDSSEKVILKKQSDKETDEAAAVILLDNILNEAKKNKASDIHIEGSCIRFRINGKLENKMILQKEKAKELVQRIKLLSGMNVMEKYRSQDGHFVYSESNPVFVRVSTMAIISEYQDEIDESVVLRILDTTKIPLSIHQLGFSTIQQEGIKRLCEEKYGLVIICGPTGAGKSTTAASMLLDIQEKQNGKLKIVSLEDPPEYIIPGVTQIQIDDTRNNTYDDALIHVFRQDPDVIMIGEIRDSKSAGAAIRASLTGHLVVATLHTMSAAGSVLRLENLGINRKIIASVLKGVVIQDLNYAGEKPELLADVGFPDYSFATEITNEMGELEIEKKFTHLTNFGDVMERTFENRRKNIILPVFQNNGNQKLKKQEA